MLYTNLEILKGEKLYFLKIAKFMYLYHHGKLPELFSLMSDRTSASAPNFQKFAPSASFGRIFYIKFGKYRRFLIASVSDFKSHEPRIVCITEFEK